MAILDLFSSRQKRERGQLPDVFVYDKLPLPLRVQIGYIVQDALGVSLLDRYTPTPAYEAYEQITMELHRHFGTLRLAEGEHPQQVLATFILMEPIVDRVLDAVELSCRQIEKVANNYDYHMSASPKLPAAQAIADLNHRFLEHGVGYQYVSGRIIRYDSQFLHAQVVKPALAL